LFIIGEEYSETAQRENAMDRRVRKTRQAILEAFVGLLAEKDFEHITMNEVADRADVNRGTVYLHYMDKFDLLDQCIDTHLAQLLEDCLPGVTHHPTKAAMQRIFEYLEQHAFLYATLLVNKGIPAFRNRLMAVMLQILREYIDESGINQDMNKEVIAQFLASAVIGVLEWWITHSMPYSTTDMVEQMWSLLERIRVVPSTSN
jgi:AcrR family transcriptional regulator